MNSRTAEAVHLMMTFADRTGLTSTRPPARYLWTDSFAVCNFLGLARKLKDARYEELALRIVDRVHETLGRHRTDDHDRRGWLSGLDDEQGAAHPTSGGLRIGKPLPEREPNEPFDAELEWERDGQYFHYLTKWMHALDRVALHTRRPDFHRFARELATTAHRAFVVEESGQKRMCWKMSIDLKRPLVSSMGQHDPLDGFVTCETLDATASLLEARREPPLDGPLADFAEMLGHEVLATSDPLGIGGLLVDACRLAQIGREPELTGALLTAAVRGLRRWAAGPHRSAPADLRLAFRELGLAIGIAGVDLIYDTGFAPKLDRHGRTSLAELEIHKSLRDEILDFWLRAENRRTTTWLEHVDINDVMLATCLEPEGFLRLLLEDAGDSERAASGGRPKLWL